jgi:transcriptional regulator with XRE-family HTH domain
VSRESREFQGRLRARREQRGWTQEELAGRCGLSQGYVCDLENGARAPSFATMAALARAFGLKISQFMEEL